MNSSCNDSKLLSNGFCLEKERLVGREGDCAPVKWILYE